MGQSEELQLKDLDMQDKEEKKLTGPKQDSKWEGNEWGSLNVGEWAEPKENNVQVKQRRKALTWTDILNLLCSFWWIVWPWPKY